MLTTKPRIIVSDGRDQSHRQTPALSGDYFQLNEMSFEQLIAVATEYAFGVSRYALGAGVGYRARWWSRPLPGIAASAPGDGAPGGPGRGRAKASGAPSRQPTASPTPWLLVSSSRTTAAAGISRASRRSPTRGPRSA